MTRTEVRARTGEVGLRDGVRAELTKLRTLPVVWAALAGVVAVNTALGVVVAADALRIAGADGGGVPIERFGTLLLAPVYLFLVIPVFASGSEYRNGQLRVTLAATPRRGELFAAKLVVTTAAVLVAAVVALVPGHLARHAGAGAATDELLLRIAVYAALGLIGFGFGFVAKGVAAPLAVLFALPVAVSPALRGGFPEVVRFLPHEVSLSLLGAPASPDTGLAPGVAAVVLAAWVVVSLVAGVVSLVRRDS